MCTVSIRMAKEQSLSLGSAKLSGPCGRLMCCLSYEYNYYVSERGKFPKHGTRVAGPSTSYTVAEVNMISRTVMLIGREGSAVAVGLDKLRFDTESKSWYADFEQEPESE
jgi:cell fate regulator YaaT (PSP1 superfamily)